MIWSQVIDLHVPPAVLGAYQKLRPDVSVDLQELLHLNRYWPAGDVHLQISLISSLTNVK
jgi:hypothetical protein